jgi:hypothetical protein
MICADARHRILLADVSALRGESDRALRAHLNGCPACSADASRVLGETRRLGAALAARTRQPEISRASWGRTAFVLVPIGVAAAMTLMVISHRRAPTEPVASPRIVVTKAPPPITTSVSDGDTDSVSPAREVSRHLARRVAAAPRGPDAVSSRPALAIPASMTTSNVFIDQPMPEVGVTVGDNQRAAIIATSNPKITVVWLTRGQQP